MGLRIYEDILEYVRRMRPVVKAIEKHDADLAKQLRRALASMLLNTAEGAKQRGGKGRNRFDDAMGSTDETRVRLRARRGASARCETVAVTGDLRRRPPTSATESTSPARR